MPFQADQVNCSLFVRNKLQASMRYSTELAISQELDDQNQNDELSVAFQVGALYAARAT